MSEALFEAVPNVSEGRDRATLDACEAALRSSGVAFAHRTSDAAHHRSVFTYFGTRESVIAASVALAGVARDRIDLRAHRGEHPRIGALDVLPFVPIRHATLDDAAAVAREAARAIWQTHGIPSLYYGAAASTSARRLLADVRRGDFEALGSREAAGERADCGDRLYHESAGAIAIGAREILIAFNVELASDDLRLARSIARRLRERDGGLKTLRALGIPLGPGRVQVSFNLTDATAIPLDRLVELVRRMAARSGVAVVRSELIGLVPRDALARVAARAFGVPASIIARPTEVQRAGAQ